VRVNIDTTWPLVRLADVVSSGPTNGYSPKASQDADGTLSLKLSATTQGFFVLNESTVKHLTEHIPASSRCWLRPGDLLVQRSNTLDYIGSAALYEGPDKTYIYPDLMMRLRCHEPATTRWLWRYLNTPTARNYFKRVAGGTSGSMPKISGEKLKELLVPLPPLEEQRRLAAILDKADALRRKRQEAIALTEQLLCSTFLEMFGDPFTNPKGWPILTLGEVISETKYGTAQKANTAHSGLPVLRMNNLTYRGGLDLKDLKWCEIAPRDYSAHTLKRGDLLFNRTNSPSLVGKSAVWVRDEAYAYAGYLIRVRFRSTRALPHYISGFLNSDYGKQMLAGMAKASSNMSNISASEIKRIRLPLPALEDQQRFSRFVESLLHAGRAHTSAVEPAADLFNALTQQAFTGQL